MPLWCDVTVQQALDIDATCLNPARNRRREGSLGADPSTWPTVATYLAIALFLRGDNVRVTVLLSDSLARFRLQGDKRRWHTPGSRWDGPRT